MNQLTLIQKRAIISVLVALGVHGAILLSWVSVILLDVDLFKPVVPVKTEQQQRPEPEVTVVLRPLLPIPEVQPKALAKQEPDLNPQPKPPAPTPPHPQPEATTPPPPPPKPSIVVKPKEAKPEKEKTLPEQKRRFARTSEDQEGKPDEPTDILGDRDTRAASELPPTAPDKPNTPSQDGRNPLRPGHLETVDRDHQKGSAGMDKTGEETETAQEATARKDSDTVDEAPKLDIPDPDEGGAAKPKNKHLKEGDLLPNTDAGEGKRTIQEKENKDEAPKEKPNKGSKKDGRGDATEQTPKKDGFQGLSRKTRVTGSISRRGKSALNVKNSPLGRYQALVSKTVELQWRRKCEEQRDHIVPGVVSVRFYVNAKGKISGVKFQEVVGASYIMTGFTQRAIRQSKLPKMSSSVIKELDGEPLELIYNFYF